MAQFYADNQIEITVEDFLAKCSEEEYQELAEEFKGKEWLTNGSLLDQEFNTAIYKLQKNRISLTIEEDILIKKIANRFLL